MRSRTSFINFLRNGYLYEKWVSYPMGAGGSITGDEAAQGMKVATYLHLALRSIKYASITSTPPYVFMVLCLIS
jgi:hypothetical protein